MVKKGLEDYVSTIDYDWYEGYMWLENNDTKWPTG